MKTKETISEKVAVLIALAFLGLFAFGAFKAMQSETSAFNTCIESGKSTDICTAILN